MLCVLNCRRNGRCSQSPGIQRGVPQPRSQDGVLQMAQPLDRDPKLRKAHRKPEVVGSNPMFDTPSPVLLCRRVVVRHGPHAPPSPIPCALAPADVRALMLRSSGRTAEAQGRVKSKKDKKVKPPAHIDFLLEDARLFLMENLEDTGSVGLQLQSLRLYTSDKVVSKTAGPGM